MKRLRLDLRCRPPHRSTRATAESPAFSFHNTRISFLVLLQAGLLVGLSGAKACFGAVGVFVRNESPEYDLWSKERFCGALSLVIMENNVLASRRRASSEVQFSMHRQNVRTVRTPIVRHLEQMS